MTGTPVAPFPVLTSRAGCVSATMGAVSSAPQRRNGPDRRRRPTPMLSAYWLRGRRRGGRRDGETRDVYVDRPSRSEWALAIAIVALGLIDAAWTLAHLGRGVPEANPLMAWAWESGGTLGFVTLKLGVTALAAGFLLLHSRFRLTRALLPLTVAAYVALLGVHAATELAVRGI